MMLELRVIPNAGRTGISGVREGRIVLKVAAPAVDGKANRAVVEYLAKSFGVARSRVRIVSGEKGRIKKLEIVGLDAGHQDVLMASLLENNS